MANILILGKAGSGKDSIANYIVENFGYEKVIITVTRPKRENEVNGKDYYFVGEDEFEQLKKDSQFALTATFRGWNYGILKSETKKDKNLIFVLSPTWFFKIDSILDEYTSFYLDCDDGERMIRQFKRAKDIDEISRRNKTDMKDFIGIPENVDFIVSSDTTIEDAADEILWYMAYKDYYSDNYFLNIEKEESVLSGVKIINSLFRI